MNNLLHTPEGVRDIYNHECSSKTFVEQCIMNQMHMFGYHRINTPTFEYFDIFNQERGSVSSREMFKFFDRYNNTLVLRPDVTPAIARCAAKFYMEETMPLRLSYLENTFVNNSNYKGRLCETTQSGAELIGDASPEADAEILIMVIEALKQTGLKEFKIELGQVDFYRGLIEDSGINADDDAILRDLIENKNNFGVEEIVEEKMSSYSQKNVFLKLPSLYGSIDDISKAKNYTDNKRALQAIDRLKAVHEIIADNGLDEYISYDLGMLSNYNYYTGIIFKVYTYGSGDYIASGGRYDNLLNQFGKEAPAVGFAITIDRLMSALNVQHINIPEDSTDFIIVYASERRKEAIQLADACRQDGLSCICMKLDSIYSESDYRNYADRMNILHMIYMGQGTDTTDTDIKTGETKTL